MSMQQAVMKRKEAYVSALKERLGASNVVVVADFRGLDVGLVTELRNSLREKAASVEVCKNTLARFAFKESGLDVPAELLMGPSMIISSPNDASEVSKVLVKFSKENENLVLKGGILDKEYIQTTTIEDLSKLPGKQELIAKTVGQIKAPLTNLLVGLKSPINGFINVLRAIQTKK